MVALKVTLSGMPELRAALARMNPAQNKRILVNSFKEGAKQIQRIAAKEKIKAGGKGPPELHRLTSRTGTGRRSIRINRGPLPHAIEVGTDLGYMALHELGGTADHKSVVVKEHTRKMAFGKKRKPFTVPLHFRSGYSAEYPARPFLAPALDDVVKVFPTIVLAEWQKEVDKAAAKASKA